MQPELERSFAKLESVTKAIVKEISAWPDERMKFRIAPTSWSAVEILDHLEKVEKAFIDTVRRNLLEGGSGTGRRNRVAPLMVNLVMRSPLRIKVPKGAEMVLPGNAMEPVTVVAGWIKTRRRLRQLLEPLSATQLRQGVFLHPIGGWMTARQGLGFLLAHLHHHRYQIRRLRIGTNHLSPPSSSVESSN